jgi:arylsulfatase A-like enzyme
MKSQNIIFLVLDTVRADHISCYSYDQDTSPTIDRLANQGIQYNTAFSNSIWTPTSHAAMFTGQVPSENNVYSGETTLPVSTPTLTERLQELGYETFLASAGLFIRAGNGYDRGIDVYHSGDDYRPRPTPRMLSKLVREPATRKQFYADLTRGPGKKTTLKMEALKQFVSNSNEPFFAFLNTKAAHHPYMPPRPYHMEYVPDHSRPPVGLISFLYRLAGDPYGGSSIEGVDEESVKQLDTQYPITADAFEPTEEELSVIRGWYDGAIRYVDDKINELISHLRRKGVYDETTIIVTSDHGELFGEHGLGKHYYSLYDQLLHVPLVIRPANGRSATINDIVSLADLYPTILDMAGADDPEDQGEWSRSLLPLDTDPGHDYVIAETGLKSDRPIKKNHPDFDDSEHNEVLQSVRTDEYKLIVNGEGETELYQWRSDPENFQDISDANPEVCEELQQTIESELSSLSGQQWADDPDEVTDDDHLQQQLEDLGYM